MPPEGILGRLRYLGASALVAWVAFTIIWSPLPPSHLKIALSPTALTWHRKLFRLTGDWDFFAPQALFGRVVAYRIKTRAGQIHDFDLSHSVPPSDPSYFRMERMFDAVTGVRGTRPSGYALNFTEYLCRRHADLEPESLQFRSGAQRVLSRDDYLRGHRRFDGDHVVFMDLEWTPCPRSRR